MKTKLLPIATLLLVVMLGLSSCLVSYHPPFAPGQNRNHHRSAPGHIKQHPKKNHSSKTTTDQKDLVKISPLMNKAPDEIITASSNEEGSTIEYLVNPIELTVIPQFSKTNTEGNVSNSTNSILSTISKEIELTTDNIVASPEPKKNSKSTTTNAVGTSQLLCVIIAFFIPPLGVLLYENKLTNNFWIDLILTLLFWLPGFIYALIVILG